MNEKNKQPEPQVEAAAPTGAMQDLREKETISQKRMNLLGQLYDLENFMAMQIRTGESGFCTEDILRISTSIKEIDNL